MMINHSASLSVEDQVKELQHYFFNYATSLELEIIMLKPLKVLKQEF